MELNLGLALSSSSLTASSSSSRFDLNRNTSYYHESAIAVHHSKKREHGDHYDDGHTPQTAAPLLVLNKNRLSGEHQDHHDCDEAQSNSSVFDHQRNNGDVIGWPPVKPCRKKLCRPKMGNGDGGVIGWPPVKLGKKKACHPKVRNNIGGCGQGERGRSKSMYVKVHMEGVGIARKVDLNLHQSFQTLVPTLANMFGKRFEDVKLTYQDKEGDWLLAGDVPWGSFIKTVRRLRVLRKWQWTRHL